MGMKPCPFCGVRPARLKNLDFSNSEAFWHPDDATDCILNGCSIHCDKWNGWNTRTPTATPSDEVVERLLSAIITWFENRTGFHNKSGDELTAYYGGNWISFDARKLAKHLAGFAALSAIEGEKK